MNHGELLGDQAYVDHMCYVISQLIDGKIDRLLINLPPQHLKSFVGTICLAAYLLGTNPRLRIIVTAYSDAFAEFLCVMIRDMMQTPWYQQAFATRIKEGHSRANDFATRENGGVFAVAATGSITGRTADFVIYDDPHEIGDWNNERKLTLVRENFNMILSRLQDKANGPVLVIAHRVSENDLSAELLQEKRWKRFGCRWWLFGDKNSNSDTPDGSERKAISYDREPIPRRRWSVCDELKWLLPLSFFINKASVPRQHQSRAPSIFKVLLRMSDRSALSFSALIPGMAAAAMPVAA